MSELRSAIDSLAAVDVRGVAEQQGRLSTSGWLTQHLRLDPADATRRVRLARRLDAMPEAWAAFEAGDISLEHARVIGTTVDEMKDEKKPWAEQVLTDTASSVEPLGLDRLGRLMRYEMDPDTADERANKQHEGRRLSVATTFGGMVSINGVLEPLAGAMVQSALNAFMAPQPHDERTAPQRRADALTEICQRILRTDQPPTNGGHRPQLLVRSDYERLVARPGASAADAGWVGPISGRDVQRVACDAEVVRIVSGAAPRSSMSAAPNAPSRLPFAARCSRSGRPASGLAATSRLSGLKATTSFRGKAAAQRASRTPRCPAPTTITSSTATAGNSRNATTARSLPA